MKHDKRKKDTAASARRKSEATSGAPPKNDATARALGRSKTASGARRENDATRGPSTTMRRYAAFLRGVSPMNCKMPELKRSFEAAGFADVRTLLSSGNVVFSAPAASETALAKNAERAIENGLGRSFPVIVRAVAALQDIISSDPYKAFRLAPDSKRIVTFLKDAPRSTLELPIEVDGARILCMKGNEVFSAYVQSPKGAVFMTLIEKTFGKNVTTRTWETVQKAAR